MNKALLVSWIGLMVLSGCTYIPVVKHEANPDFKSLRVAMLPIMNGENSTVESVAELAEPFQESFRTVFTAGTVEEAQARNADLIIALSIDRIFGTFFGRAKIDISATMTTADNRLIDSFEIHASQRSRPPYTSGKEIDRVAVEKARDQIAAELFGSEKLKDFARIRAPLARQAAALARNSGTTAARQASSSFAPVYYSDVDEPSYKGRENPDDFALVIGIEKYADLPEAEFAERDAAAVRKHLLALGYPPRNVLFLTGMQAGKASIEKYVGSWLPRNVKESSQVFVYFSGHGAPDTKTGQAYLVPWDGDVKYLENTGYPMKRFYEKLNALKAKRVVVFLDACFSGAGGRSVIPRGTRPLVTKVDTGAGSVEKLVVLAAAAGDEITGTDETQGHGLFTYYLLKGLNGEAWDKRGRVTLKNLYDYLTPKVQDAARRQNRDQTPALIGSQPEQVLLHAE